MQEGKKSPTMIILQIPNSAVVAGKFCHRANRQILLLLLKGLRWSTAKCGKWKEKNQNYFQEGFYRCFMWKRPIIYIHLLVIQWYFIGLVFRFCIKLIIINALLMIQNCSIFRVENKVFSSSLNNISARFHVSLLLIVLRTILITVMKFVFQRKFIGLTWSFIVSIG